MPRRCHVLRSKSEEVRRIYKRAAEYHGNEDDVFYVGKGEMFFVLGGEPSGQIDTEDDLTWTCPAAEIHGGEKLVVREGDVVVIPAGNWHSWVAPDLATYAVAKVPAIEGRLRPVGA